MPILPTIATPFGSELSLSDLFAIDDTRRKRIDANSSKDSHDTIETTSCSKWSFSFLEAEVLTPKSILKKATNSSGSIDTNEDEHLQSWIEQPIPGCIESSIGSSNRQRQYRRRISGQSSNKYYACMKRRFLGRQTRRSRQEPRVRQIRTEKTVEEQWVRTCRFLW
ncbi:unnamed protein product [Cylindrotheca closterium]|uniref:Uncharacterized protein n=1 Tax=Cylindrotheca closterium TaxID=2856 RepID=A0AAD2FGF8_9STRA|nr:unnamed protein product [Cylindrotheca closterium]